MLRVINLTWNMPLGTHKQLTLSPFPHLTFASMAAMLLATGLVVTLKGDSPLVTLSSSVPLRIQPAVKPVLCAFSRPSVSGPFN